VEPIGEAFVQHAGAPEITHPSTGPRGVVRATRAL